MPFVHRLSRGRVAEFRRAFHHGEFMASRDVDVEWIFEHASSWSSWYWRAFSIGYRKKASEMFYKKGRLDA